MATKYNGLFDYAANYNVQLAQPLDTRGVCDSVAALLAKDTFGTGGSFAYDGLTVVVPNAGVYYLKDKSKLTAKVNAAGYVDPVSATDEELLAAGWQKLGDQAASNVNSVNGKTGNVTLAAGDIGITTIEGVEGENIQAALEAINAKASTAYKYKGSKATYEELPAEGNKVGDVWNVVAAHGTTPAGTNYAWTGTEWDALGGLVDLSTYQTKAITIDDVATTVEAAIAANKTSAANNATAINKNKTDIETVSGSVKSLDTLVKSKQDATVDVSVNGTSYTTIPEAIGALDTYVGEVKAVSDGAAKVDASNITDTGAWKTKLGYALESSLNTVATNVETVSGDLKSLSTKVNTISGDLDTLEVLVGTKASNIDLQTVSAQVDVNTAAIGTKATQADMTALSGKVETNTSAIAAANTAIEGKADKATTLAGYNIGDAYTKTEVDTKLGKKQDKLIFYSEEDLYSDHGGTYGKYATIDTSADSGGDSIVNINTKSLYEGDSKINLHANNTYGASLISLSAHSGDAIIGGGISKISLAAVNDEYDGSQITKSYNSNIDVDCKSITLSSNALSIKLDGYSQTTPGIYINGELRGSSISTSIPASNAVDTKVVSEKAVATAIAGKADKATTLAGYNISDAYTKTETGEQITSAVNTAKSELQTAIDGKVAKTDITTTIAASSAASDTKVPSEKAVASAVEEVKAVASTAYKYKGSDTYENIIVKENPAVGDVWNSTTANGVYPKGTNYAWNGTEWDALGGEVDLSAYQVKAITVGETSTTVEAAINANKTAIDANKTAIDAHVAKQDNPHNVTAAQVGLDKVDNTADADKPVSTAQQAALDLKQDKTDNTLATTSKTVVGAINEVKGVADAAAKADASNITVSTWKDKLGFITASEVPEQVQPDWNATSGKGQILNKPNINSGTSSPLGIKEGSDITQAQDVDADAISISNGMCSVVKYVTNQPTIVYDMSTGTSFTIEINILGGGICKIHDINLATASAIIEREDVHANSTINFSITTDGVFINIHEPYLLTVNLVSF